MRFPVLIEPEISAAQPQPARVAAVAAVAQERLRLPFAPEVQEVGRLVPPVLELHSPCREKPGP